MLKKKCGYCGISKDANTKSNTTNTNTNTTTTTTTTNTRPGLNINILPKLRPPFQKKP